MDTTTSKSMAIIKSLDRETLEKAFFLAAATLRGIAKGEMPAPPKTADRTAITISMIKLVQMIDESAKPKQEPEIEVSDITEAANILKNIATKKEGE